MITLGQLASRYAAASKKAPGSKELKRLAVVGVGLMKRQIQNFHAVDTGTMLNSTTYSADGNNSFLIGPTVDYAIFVAEGTSSMPPRPFHRMAAAQLKDQVRELGFDPDSVGI